MTETTIDHINKLRTRILAGEDPSADEMAQVIQQLRGERTAPSKASSKKKEPPKPLDLNALFGSTPEKPTGDDAA